ncbi:hypothetical protein MO867_11350 [Microbulbifer sp. OS29]|uniref:Uncharacterized protein n=2 Tax=Microbulbifer okhotskensis TaxID=2926617 RepID=A0A9X2J603_9GAMM|nr:hypothetical protein [Microbulbifer okhotskensis]
MSCVVASSLLLPCLLYTTALLAVSLLWLCVLPYFLFWPSTLFILIYARLESRRIKSARGLLATRERRWFWRPQGGEVSEFHFVGELVLWRWLVVINGRDTQGRSLRLVLARDAMVSADWRRLQVALRYSR